MKATRSRHRPSPIPTPSLPGWVRPPPPLSPLGVDEEVDEAAAVDSGAVVGEVAVVAVGVDDEVVMAFLDGAMTNRGV